MDVADNSNKKIVNNYFKKRRAIVSRRRVVALLLTTLTLSMGYILVFKTGLFTVKTVNVQAFEKEKLENTEVGMLAAATLERFKGEKLFLVDIEEVEDYVEGLSPYIRDVFISKTFPDGMKVEVVERIPFITVVLENGCYLLDPEGYVLEDATVSSEGGTETEKKSTGCNEFIKEREIPGLYSTELKAQFTLGQQSTFYEINKILKISRALEARDYKMTKVTLKEGLYNIDSAKKRFVFSATQDIDLQLKRFVVVSEEVERADLSFTTLDLRYERPVLTK